MLYNEFLTASTREDVKANDHIHYFSKYFAPRLAYTAYKIGLTPNQVTFIFLFLGIGSGVALSSSLPFICYILWRLHIIVDMADGSVARATKVFSPNAVGFDRCNHVIINTTILLVPLTGYVDLIAANGLVVSFYLYYFFSRNFVTKTPGVHSFSVTANLAKDIVGLEGYIALMCTFAHLGLNDYIPFLVHFYSAAFAGLFLIKLFRIVYK